jgi:sulfide:quinone oxidoreductase
LKLVRAVYAVGDVTSIPTPHGYVPYLPKAGVFAHGQAEAVAHNIAVEIKGKGKLKEWDGHGSCFLEVGHGESGFIKGDFLAEPKPDIEFHMPARIWHMQKVLFEKYWMHHWF